MQKEQKKNKRGRPSPYKKEFNDLAYKYCLLGATDKRLAEFFEIDEATINRWKVKYPKFCEALKDGRERADAEVADSLFQKAKGYSHKDTYLISDLPAGFSVKGGNFSDDLYPTPLGGFGNRIAIGHQRNDCRI